MSYKFFKDEQFNSIAFVSTFDLLFTFLLLNAGASENSSFILSKFVNDARDWNLKGLVVCVCALCRCKNKLKKKNLIIVGIYTIMFD